MPLASTTEAVELRLRPTARIFFPPISTAPRLEIADPRVQTQYNPAPQQDSVVGVAFRALQLVECRHAPGSLGLTGEQLSCGAGRQPRASPDQTSPRRRCPTMVDRRSPVANKVIDHSRLLPYPSYLDCKACETIAGWLRPQTPPRRH